jgi:hypothetical protein
MGHITKVRGAGSPVDFIICNCWKNATIFSLRLFAVDMDNFQIVVIHIIRKRRK